MNSNYYLFYKKYHQNKINKLIHLFCIPLIVWSFCVLLNNLTILSHFKFNNSNIFTIDLDLSAYICLFYLIIYTFIESSTFFPMFLYLTFIYFTSYFFNLYVIKSIMYALFINIFSWIMQFIGHFFFEGNRPALMDSLVQSFLMAPLFSYFEFKELINKKKINK